MLAAATPTLSRREAIRCHVCSGERYSPYLDGRGCTIVRCHNCGLLYVNPQPGREELEQIYASFDQGDQWRRGEENFNRGVRKLILHFKKSGAAMDIGSGSGNFLRCLRESGFEVFGVEPSQTGSEYARSVHGIDTFTGAVESFIGSGRRRRFYVITKIKVLEHLKDPANTLIQLQSLLENDGILVIVVPDARLHAWVGRARRRLGFSDPFWMETSRHPLVGFDPPHHLCSFEPKTICRLVARCGFEALDVRNPRVVFNDDGWKNVAKTGLHALSEMVFWLTLKRVVVGYSTLVVCRKAATTPAVS